jgi:hypothetical protein
MAVCDSQDVVKDSFPMTGDGLSRNLRQTEQILLLEGDLQPRRRSCPETSGYTPRTEATAPELNQLDWILEQPCSHVEDQVFQCVFQELEQIFQRSIFQSLVRSRSDTELSTSAWSSATAALCPRRSRIPAACANDNTSYCSTRSENTHVSQSAMS